MTLKRKCVRKEWGLQKTSRQPALVTWIFWNLLPHAVSSSSWAVYPEARDYTPKQSLWIFFPFLEIRFWFICHLDWFGAKTSAIPACGTTCPSYASHIFLIVFESVRSLSFQVSAPIWFHFCRSLFSSLNFIFIPPPHPDAFSHSSPRFFIWLLPQPPPAACFMQIVADQNIMCDRQMNSKQNSFSHPVSLCFTTTVHTAFETAGSLRHLRHMCSFSILRVCLWCLGLWGTVVSHWYIICHTSSRVHFCLLRVLILISWLVNPGWTVPIDAAIAGKTKNAAAIGQSLGYFLSDAQERSIRPTVG